MGIVVTNRNRPIVKISAKNAEVGKHYRRSSDASKLYVGIRDPRDLSQCLLVSITHGNSITRDINREDFIEVNLEVTAIDA